MFYSIVNVVWSLQPQMFETLAGIPQGNCFLRVASAQGNDGSPLVGVPDSTLPRAPYIAGCLSTNNCGHAPVVNTGATFPTEVVFCKTEYKRKLAQKMNFPACL